MSDDRDELTVCYNGACPVCRTEIDHYRRQAPDSAGLRFLDIAADPAAAARLGLAGDHGFQRLHTVDGKGRLVAGIPAFILIWRRLPRYRWLARTFDRRAVRAVATFAYERILAPALFSWHRLRQRSAGSRRG